MQATGVSSFPTSVATGLTFTTFRRVSRCPKAENQFITSDSQKLNSMPEKRVEIYDQRLKTQFQEEKSDFPPNPK